MISIDVRRAAFSLVAMGALSMPCLAQKSFVFPHVFERDGQIVAVGWDLSGGQYGFEIGTDAAGGAVVRPVFLPVGALFSLYGNDEIFKKVEETMLQTEDNTTFLFEYRIFPVRKGQVGQNLAIIPTVADIVFPVCDVNSKEPAGIEVYFNPKEYRLASTTGAEQSKAADYAVKKQKMWLPSNFRLKIGDLPCSNVSKVKPEDRPRPLPPPTTSSPLFGLRTLEITIPLSDAEPFREALRSTIEGTPKTPTLRLEYLDDDGGVLLAIEMPVIVTSVDKADPSDPFDPSDLAKNKDKPVNIKVHNSGHVILMR